MITKVINESNIITASTENTENSNEVPLNENSLTVENSNEISSNENSLNVEAVNEENK